SAPLIAPMALANGVLAPVRRQDGRQIPSPVRPRFRRFGALFAVLLSRANSEKNEFHMNVPIPAFTAGRSKHPYSTVRWYYSYLCHATEGMGVLDVVLPDRSA